MDTRGVNALLGGRPCQDVIRVSHKDAVEDLIRKGKDLEKIVLARAIWLHLNHQILVYNNKTVVFEYEQTNLLLQVLSMEWRGSSSVH